MTLALTNTADLKARAHKELPPFLERIEPRSHTRASHDLEQWADAGILDTRVKLIPNRLQSLGKWYCDSYALTGIEGAPDIAFLALSTRASINGFLFEVPLYDFHPRNLGRYSLSYFGKLLPQIITTGWKDHSELVARIGFEELGRLMDRGIAFGRLGWFMLELAKDWLKADVNLETEFREVEVHSLEVWDDLLDGWRTPDADAFDRLMARAADYHLAQSRYTEEGEEEQYFEFEDIAHWLFPVELLAVVRLREWEGISTPKLSHPLFSATPLGRLLPPPDMPQLRTIDRTEAAFRRHYPNTPKLADLHQLRTKQGGWAI